MKVKGIIYEDFVNYKKTCMNIQFPYCDFKCNKECEQEVCHNMHMKDMDIVNIDPVKVAKQYKDNYLTSAIVCQGLEPLDSMDDLVALLKALNTYRIKDDFVIYTGYNEDEVLDKIQVIKDTGYNGTIIMKFGRFIPDSESIEDEVLGVTLASSNQYAKIIKY